MNKEVLLWMLKTRSLAVYFTKKDGTKRIMICTLREPIIPKVDNVKEKPDGLITVWDIENKGWRSFYMDSILEVKALVWADVYTKGV